jgi:hypothetical protein
MHVGQYWVLCHIDDLEHGGHEKILTLSRAIEWNYVDGIIVLYYVQVVLVIACWIATHSNLVIDPRKHISMDYNHSLNVDNFYVTCITQLVCLNV